MAYDDGFSRRSGSERELQPVAIVSVDPVSRMAVGVTRTRHTIRINCAYATGETITTPAVGEQWYCERFAMEWRLYGRIPFNDPTLNIEPEAGQVLVGSGTGPLELNGTEIRSNGTVFRLNGVYYRDSGQALERSVDKVTWESITAGGLVQIVAKALTDYQGATQSGAVTALEGWAAIVQEVLDNFNLFWDLICGNVFVSGLRRLGVGETEVAKIVDGFQNFLNYLFGIVFCDFDGDLTPQTMLAQLRDLLAPLINNPFVQGLQAIADILGVAVGNLLNDAVLGLTNLTELIFDIITCNWPKLLDPETSLLAKIVQIIDLADGENPFGPANIVKSIFNLFQFLGSPEIDGVPNPVGLFVGALGSIIATISEASGNLLQDAVQGAVELLGIIFGILTCDADALTKAGLIVDAIVPGEESIVELIIQTLTAVLAPLTQDEILGLPNPVALFLKGLREFYEVSTQTTATNLLDGAVGGAVEIVRLIFRTLTCSDPNVLQDFITLADSLVPGDGTTAGLPQEIMTFISNLLTAIMENPIVMAIQSFVLTFLPDLSLESLVTQLLEGSTTLINWFLKIATSILPFRALWEALLPFVDWVAVDEVELALPDLSAFFAGGIADLWKVLFKPIDDLINTLLGLSTDNAGVFTSFIENLAAFFQPVAQFFSDPQAFLADIDLGLAGQIIPALLTNVFKIVTLDGGVLRLVEDLVPTIGNAIINFMSLFGIDAADLDIDPGTFNPGTWLSTIATTIVNNIFGFGAAVISNIVDSVMGLFGGSAAFDANGNLNIVTAATYFVQNVLNLATSALQGILDTVGSLAYNIATWIIGAIRGIPFGIGDSIADLLQGLLDGFVNLGRGSVQTGSNILVDAGAEYASFWSKQTGVATRDLVTKRSQGASLRVVSGGSTAKTFWFNVNDLGDVFPIYTGTGEVNYAECWVLYPTNVDGTTNGTATSGTVTLVAQFTNSLGEASPATTELTATAAMTRNQSNWVKLSGTFTTPAATTGFYDRVSFGFRLASGQTTSGAKFFVDDMLVREISEAAATNNNLYGTPKPSAGTKVPATSVGSNLGTTSLATDLTNLNTGVTGASGAAAGAVAAASGANVKIDGTNGLLWGGVAGSNNGKIRTAVFPDSIGAVGSGILLRKTSAPSVITSNITGLKLDANFYNVPEQSTPDLLVQNNSGVLQVQATVTGWYMVELSFGITRALKMYQFYFNPVLWRNNIVYKFGGGVSNAAYYRQDGFITISLSVAPEMCQSSFIVYMNVGDTIQPGYVWHPDPQDSRSPTSGTDSIIAVDAYGWFNYFSMGLLNRSLA